jgi:hypothetical protein
MAIKRELQIKKNWEVIFTPPYNSMCQPIEEIWAYVKNYVAARYTVGRTEAQLRQQTLDGFYGDGGGHAAVSGALCSDFIRHTHEYLDKFVQEYVPGALSLAELAAKLRNNQIPDMQARYANVPVPADDDADEDGDDAPSSDEDGDEEE